VKDKERLVMKNDDRRRVLRFGALVLGAGVLARAFRGSSAVAKPVEETFEVVKTDAEWRAQLSPAAYKVLREHGTERAGTSPLDHEKRAGTFLCDACALPLFSSEAKFDSGTGWPSFYAPLPDAVHTREDRALFMSRTEVHWRRCGGHLGHVFDDGPKPTGKRYCMNGVAMTFEPKA
jgi:peptide-methionine (R)-S-oxide reductase